MFASVRLHALQTKLWSCGGSQFIHLTTKRATDLTRRLSRLMTPASPFVGQDDVDLAARPHTEGRLATCGLQGDSVPPPAAPRPERGPPPKSAKDSLRHRSF